MAEEAFSGSFDSLLVAFAPTDSLKTTEGNSFYQTETPPNGVADHHFRCGRPCNRCVKLWDRTLREILP